MTNEEYAERERLALQEAEQAGDLIAGRWGFVRYVDKLGTDSRIVQAARVSYGAGTRTPSADEALIYRLLRSGHTSPFEQIEIVFHLGVPVFTARQLNRHRTASLNEYSGRYSEIPDESWTPEAEDIRVQSATDKQMSEGQNADAAAIAKLIAFQDTGAYQTYQELLAMGAPREQARAVLPQSQFTYLYWKIDGNNFLKFAALRRDAHAQKEIRDLADAMWVFFAREFPMTAAAWDKAVWKGARLTGPQMEVVRGLIGREYPQSELAQAVIRAGMVTSAGGVSTEGRELMELLGYE